VLRRDRTPMWRWLALGAAVVTLLTGAVVAAKRSAASRTDAAAIAAPVHVRPTPLVTVVLQSVPSGAAVLDERATRIGVTPTDLVVPAGSARRVTFQKPGFRPVDHQFEAQTDTTIAVRLDPEPGTVRERPRGQAHLSPSSTIDPFHRSRRAPRWPTR
jgi:hypothetical protein